jgi:hypothetical protein
MSERQVLERVAPLRRAQAHPDGRQQDAGGLARGLRLPHQGLSQLVVDRQAVQQPDGVQLNRKGEQQDKVA